MASREGKKMSSYVSVGSALPVPTTQRCFRQRSLGCGTNGRS